jgi:hypothetical protein
MNPGAPPDTASAPIAGTRSPFPWATALARGLLAFLTVALVGQLIAFAMGLVRGGLATSTIAKLGWFYALAMHRVPIEVGGSMSAGYRVSVAFLTGTAFAVWVLYRQGRAVGQRVGGSAWRAALAGSAIAPTYAIPFALLTLTVKLDLGAGFALLGPTGIRLQGAAVQASVLPLLLAAGAGAAGGLMAALPSESWVRVAVAGGWRMFCVALGVALVGLLVLAAVRPAGLATYARAMMGHGLGTDALLTGHQALLLPNQTLFVLVPSMGGCVGVHGTEFWYPLVCPGQLPRLEDAFIPLSMNPPSPVVGPSFPSRSVPIAYALFLLVPLVATVWAGRAIRTAVDAQMWSRAVICAGAVFACCIGVGSWLAGITVRNMSPPRPSSVTLGVRVLPTALIALAWGLGGGAIGGLLARRQGAVDPVGPPPNPTSE